MTIISAKHSAGSGDRPIAAYVSVGPRLIHYGLDIENAALVQRESIALPENIQYAWPHTSGDYLYVASSNGGPGGTLNNRHCVSALRIDPTTRALAYHGEPVSLPSRPIHITVDAQSDHALIAYNQPSGLTVHRLNGDGTVGELVKQDAPLDFGIYPHQIRISPSNKLALLVTRGNDPVNGKLEDPGALKIYNYQKGVLTEQSSIAPNEGYGFGPRHLDIHADLPWVFVSLERQNKLYAFSMDEHGRIDAEAGFKRETLADPDTVRPRQMAGAIHVHPNGRYLYVANRALGLAEYQGKTISAEGETGIAVYTIDARTGEPTKIQNIDTRGGHPRTFAIDPTGRVLIAANSTPLVIKNGSGLVSVPANLAVFQIENNGMLRYVRKYEFPAGSADIFWMNMIA